jgi:hypothetical protein
VKYLEALNTNHTSHTEVLDYRLFQSLGYVPLIFTNPTPLEAPRTVPLFRIRSSICADPDLDPALYLNASPDTGPGFAIILEIKISHFSGSGRGKFMLIKKPWR